MTEALELIEQIKTAFANVKTPLKTLDQCFITDEFGIGGLSDEEFNHRYENAGKLKPYTHWTDIPNELIEKFDPPFFNMSDEEFTFFLPAYMIYVIKDYLKNPHQNWWEHKILLDVAYYLGIDLDYDTIEYRYLDPMSKQQKIAVFAYASYIVDLTYAKTKEQDFYDNFQKKTWHEYHLETVLRAKNKMFGYFARYFDT